MKSDLSHDKEAQSEQKVLPSKSQKKPFERKTQIIKAGPEDHSLQDSAFENRSKKLKPKLNNEENGHKPVPFHKDILNRILSSPTRTIVIGFALTILVGGFLLCLPISSQDRTWTHPVIAYFTATSATCVTGLVVVDTATHWSYWGQFFIAALIQIGGLGIVTISSFFMMAARRKVKMKTMLAMQESTGSESFVEARTLVKKILLITFTCEFTGALILTWRYAQYFPFFSAMRRAFFQAVSAFCNAGFDLMGDVRGEYTNLNTWNNEPIVLLVTASLLIVGGLGFVVWTDLISFPKKRKLQFHSKLVLGATAVLLTAGTLIFALLEWNNTKTMSLGSLPEWQRPVAAFFQSATLRTAGFSSIDQVNLTQASKIIAIILMFIGAGPASTGGGIKLTTFSVIVFGAISFLKGEKKPIIGRHRINLELFIKSFVIAFLGLIIVGLAGFLLLMFENSHLLANHFDFIDLVFESTSAFATVGNSTTPTANLTMASWITLIPCMYLGRVGPASFAMSFAFSSPKAVESVYPEGKTFVG